jgi:hypothetical protein
MAIQFSSAQSRGLATLIEAGAQAKRRIANEYDGAQARQFAKAPKGNVATAAEVGLTHKQIHEARAVRSAARDS